MYLFPFLHQTTTPTKNWKMPSGCISFLFYIKPQLISSIIIRCCSCISFLFYIKPQLGRLSSYLQQVVSLSFSTSNHNCRFAYHFGHLLYLFPFLHQTTTLRCRGCSGGKLYLFPFLHQTTTYGFNLQDWISCISFLFYIKPQQIGLACRLIACCISFLFYIKPQQFLFTLFLPYVVSLSFSTSNHNCNPVV